MSQPIAVRNRYTLTAKDPANEPDFYSWCETRLEAALEADVVLTHATCWETEHDRTISLCLAFRGSEYRPSNLDLFNRMCSASPDLVDAMEDGQIITDAVIEEALFAPDIVRGRMPLDLREVCDRYRNHVFEAAQSWGWVRDLFNKQIEMSRCSCRLFGGCVC